MPPPGSVPRERVIRFRKQQPSTFRRSAQRDPLKLFSVCTMCPRSAVFPTVTAHKSTSCVLSSSTGIFVLLSCVVPGFFFSSAVLSLLSPEILILRCVRPRGRHYVQTIAVRRALLREDPRFSCWAGRTLPVCADLYCVGVCEACCGCRSLSIKNWVRFVKRAWRSSTSRRRCFAVLICRSEQFLSGGEWPLSGKAYLFAPWPRSRSWT